MKSTTKLSKIYTSSSGTKQSPTIANNLTKVGSTQSRKNTNSTQESVRFRGILKIAARP